MMSKFAEYIRLHEQGLAAAERAEALVARTPPIRGVAAWLWDVPGDTVRFSEEWRHIMLYPEDEQLERDVSRWWPEMVHEDDIVPFLEMARDIAEGKTRDYQVLFRVRRSDGSWAWLFGKGVVTESRNGKPVYVYGLTIDISQMRTDVKFQHGGPGSVHAEHTGFENSPDLFVRLDRELFPLYANRMLSQYIKHSGSLTDGEHSAESMGITPEYLAMLQRNVDSVYENGVAVREQVSFPTAYGHDVIGEYSFWPELDLDGKVIAVMTQFRDITERVLAERRAQLNERRLEKLHKLFRMDDAPRDEQQAFVVESLVRITESKAGFMFLQHENGKRDIIWSESAHALFAGEQLPETATAEQLAKLLDVERRERFVSTIRNGTCLQPVCKPFGGRASIMRYMLAPVFEDNRMVCVACVCNKATEYMEADLQELEAFVSGAWFILRRHEYVRRLQEAKERAETAYKTMAEFLTNVNHELRTPLTSILGYTETLSSLGPEEHAFRNRCIEVVQSQAAQMHSLVMDLLNMSKIEGAVPLNIASTSLRELAQSNVSALYMQLSQKHLHVRMDIDPELTVRVDSQYMSQVFRNIIENAITYAAHGTDISVRAMPGSDSVTVRIHNEGSCIEESELEQIFERFYRGKKNAGAFGTGSGVGLSICKQVVERHGGRIWAESSASGVTLSFTLPV